MISEESLRLLIGVASTPVLCPNIKTAACTPRVFVPAVLLQMQLGTPSTPGHLKVAVEPRVKQGQGEIIASHL